MEAKPIIDEKSVIRAVLDGHTSGFNELVLAHQHRLTAGLYAMLGNRQDAEDVTQEAFSTAYRKLASYESRSSFYTWLHRIAFNLAIDHKRRDRRHTNRNAPMDENLLASDIDSPSEHLDRQEDSRQLYQALSQIDPERRAVITLRDLQGLNYDEISECLGIPIGTVRSRLHRARLELKEVLLSQGQWEVSP